MTEPIPFLTPRLVGEELRSLRAGWLEGKGVAPPIEGLEWLSRTFAAQYPDDLPRPYLFPTPEGGIQAEWSLGSREVTLEISLETHRGEWHALDLTTDWEDQRNLDLDAAQDREWLFVEIRRISSVEPL